MGETDQIIAALTPKDRIFLQRARKNLNVLWNSGWFLVALAVFVGVLVSVNYDRLFSKLQGVQLSVTEKLHAENARLRTLQTTTRLEKELVEKQLEQNQRIEVFFHMIIASTALIVLAMVIGGLLTHGVSLLIQAHCHRRYLKILEAFEGHLRTYPGSVR